MGRKVWMCGLIVKKERRILVVERIRAILINRKRIEQREKNKGREPIATPPDELMDGSSPSL